MSAHGEKTVYRGVYNHWGFKVVDVCKNVRASQIAVFYKNCGVFFKKKPLNQCSEQNLTL